MNLENLLRETLSDLAHEEPPPAPGRFLRAAEPRPRRRRGVAVLAASAVAALAVASTLVVHGVSSRDRGDAAAPPTPAQQPMTFVTVPEGVRLAQLFKTLSSFTGRPVAEFERAAADGAALGLPSYAKGALEGFIPPGVHELSPSMSPEEILRTLVIRFGRAAEKYDLVEIARRAGRTPLEMLTIASIVQAEAHQEKDMAKIARVIHNRLDRKMSLRMDSPLLYGLNKYGAVATLKDTRSRTPYNTYRHAGLPPGPIGNPGSDAIRAALHPAPGSWLYFVATDPEKGTLKFATSASEYADLVKERNG
ncbi:endolytic transglycosylase MltG [Nonomuraea sp. NPDC050404]|uniref:endolytic transglycosylase MltG n=1 Tax=Nonomuraea sp. NPDC050404 TaxID=3155783 RepID=UPI0033E8E7EE